MQEVQIHCLLSTLRLIVPSLNTIATTLNDLDFWTRTECVCLHRQGLGHSGVKGVTSHYYRIDHYMVLAMAARDMLEEVQKRRNLGLY